LSNLLRGNRTFAGAKSAFRERREVITVLTHLNPGVETFSPPGFYFALNFVPQAKAELYSAFSRQLSGSVVLGPRPFVLIREILKRISISMVGV
jgi:hypothetical protein